MYDFQRFLAARDARDAAKVGAAWSIFLIVRWAMAVGIALLALTGIAGVTDSEKVMPQVLLEFMPAGIRGIVLAGLLAAFMSTFSSTVNSGASFIVRDIWQPYFRPRAGDAESVRAGYWATLLLVAVGLIIGSLVDSVTQIWNWMMMVLGAGLAVPNVLRWYWWRMNGWGYALGTFGGMILSLAALLFDEMPVYYVFPTICLASLLVSIVVSLATKPVDRDVLVGFYGSVRPFGLWKPVAACRGRPALASQSRVAGVAPARVEGVSRGEGVPPLRPEAVPASAGTEQGQDALATRGQDARDTQGPEALATRGQACPESAAADRGNARDTQEAVSRAVLNVLLGMLAIAGLYLFPMYLVGHWYGRSMLWLALAVGAVIALRFTWYRHLPAPGNDDD